MSGRFKGWRPGVRELERMEKEGKIKGFQVREEGARKKLPPFVRSRERDWMSWYLAYWCQTKSLVLVREYAFHPERAWRFDWAIPALRLGIEYEGLVSAKSRHTTLTGYSGDAEKYNEAQVLGWVVFRFTALNYKSISKMLDDFSGKLIFPK